MLSLAATALAQAQGDENGTDQVETAETAKTNWLEQNAIEIGAIAALIAIIAAIIKFFSRIKNYILAHLGKMPTDSTRPIQQVPTENRTTAASGEGSVAIGGDASGNLIATGDVVLTPEALDLLRPRYRPPSPPPSNVLPTRNGLPPGKRLDFLANEVFTGREEDLLELAHILLHEPNSRGAGITQASAAATGLGGIGKSQLAVEFCYRYGRFFHGVHWIQSDLDISAEVAACGAAMNLPRWPDKVPEQVALTLRTWEGGGPRLVVLDNVEDPATVQEWLPKMPLARLILTSRRSEWPNDMGLLIRPLGVLALPESITLLRKLVPRLEDVADSDLKNLADRFGCLPLALDLAGRYLHDRTDLSIEDYLAELEEAGNSLKHTSLKDWADHNPTKHATNLAATFALSWDQLGEGEADVLARLIFLTCGYCAPNTPIPKSLLEKATGTDSTSQKQKLDLALRRLSRLGLLTPTESGPSLHPLLSEFAKYLDVEDAVLPSLAEALSVLSYDAHKTGLPERLMPLREHLKSVAKVAENAELEMAGSLWNNLGCQLKEVAEYKNAEEAHRRALEFNEKVYGPDHPQVAISVNNLGGVLDDLGDLASAKKSYERALEIDEKVYGPDNLNVARDLNNLGGVLNGLGDLDGAKKSYERALEIGEKALGPDHPDVAIFVNNLGGVLNDLGDLDSAKKSYERALEIDEKVYGPNHPSAATDVNNLGGVLRDLGDLDGAKKSFEQALEIDEKVYGPDHPKVARDVNNLGLISQALGDLAAAKKSYERALEIDEKVYGPDHPEVATIVNNFGGVLRDLGDLDGAKESYERTLEIDEKVYGPDHPNVAKDLNNLGEVLRALGDLAGAKKSFERALEIDEKVYGPDHPNVAIDVNNLGVILRDLGDLDGAKKSYERALEINEKICGPDHPEVATVVNNLGSILRDMGDIEGAKENCERALEILRNRLGEDHPTTKLVRKNLESLRR